MTQIAENIKKDTVSLPFFGIPRILPYVRKYRNTLLAMARAASSASVLVATTGTPTPTKLVTRNTSTRTLPL